MFEVGTTLDATKEKRRVSQKDHTSSDAGTRNMIQPSLEVLFRKDETYITRTVSMVDGNALAPNLPTFAHDPNAFEAIRESTTPPLVCCSVERKVTTPKIVSDESFLHDYWGE
jgi:hypothetical protein